MKWIFALNININKYGFTILGAVISSVIVFAGVIASGYLISNSIRRYRNIAANDAILAMEDEIKIPIMSALKLQLRMLASEVTPCSGKSALLPDPPSTGLRLRVVDASPNFDSNDELKKTCDGTGSLATCASPGFSPVIIKPGDTVNYSLNKVYCYCAQITVSELKDTNAKIAQITGTNPIYVWFRYQALDVTLNDPLLTCTQLSNKLGPVESAKIINRLDYVIFWPQQFGNNNVYLRQPGNYMVGGF